MLDVALHLWHKIVLYQDMQPNSDRLETNTGAATKSYNLVLINVLTVLDPTFPTMHFSRIII